MIFGTNSKSLNFAYHKGSTTSSRRHSMPSIMAMASIPTPSRNLIDQQTVNVADAFALSNGKLKPHSTPATLCWLEKNYELSEGVCIPRNVVYYNYTDFCRKNNMLPVNAASFGKVTAFFYSLFFYLVSFYCVLMQKYHFRLFDKCFQISLHGGWEPEANQGTITTASRSRQVPSTTPPAILVGNMSVNL